MHSLLKGEYEHALLQEFSSHWYDEYGEHGERGGGTGTWVVQVVLSFFSLGGFFLLPPTPVDVGGGGVAYLARLCLRSSEVLPSVCCLRVLGLGHGLRGVPENKAESHPVRVPPKQVPKVRP